MNKNLLLLPLVLAIAACTAAEPHQDSGIPAPGLWTRLTKSDNKDVPLTLDTTAAVEQKWWAHFHDPALDGLIAQGLAGNKNLQIAKARVAEARANRKASIAALLPQLEGVGTAARENEGFLFDEPVGVAEADLEASWQLDLFGQNQARAAAAQAIIQSADADRQGTAVTLLSDIAHNYFDYRDAQSQIAITEKNLADQKKTLDVTRNQFSGGELSNLDVQRTVAQVATTESELPSLRARRDADLNALAVLTGNLPGAVDAGLNNPAQFAPLDPHIIVSAPASVLAARPDVRAAERRFASTISLKKAATRAWFPTVSLSALYGVQDASILIARPWTLAAGLTQPILNFGAISSQIDAANARQQQAFLSYQETVLEAVQDMENALSSYGHESERNQSLQQSYEATTKAEDLAHQQFEAGEINLLDVLIAERDALAAQSSLAASDAMLRQDLVHIYTAAGGGWQVDGT